MLSNSKNSQQKLYRHGDVLLASIASLPPNVHKRAGTILATGELTGHSHRIQQQDAIQLWTRGHELFLEVKQAATLIHEEHRAIELPSGIYRVWKQRQYSPDGYLEIED